MISPLKLLAIFVFSLVIFLVSFYMLIGIPEPLHGYYPDEPESLPPRLQRELSDNVDRDKVNFFVVEATDRTNIEFPYRRTIESALYFHPNAIIHIYSYKVTLDGFQDLLEKGYDIRAERIEFPKLLEGFPEMEKWYADEKWKTDEFLEVNISNLLRFLLLYKFGGIYLDTDVVVLKPLVSSFRNTLGWQSDNEEVNTAVLIFEKGHPLCRRFLIEFAKEYKPSIWGNNGVGRLNWALGTRRKEEDKLTLSDSEAEALPLTERWRLGPKHRYWKPKFPDVRVVISDIFYPINWDKWHILANFKTKSEEGHLKTYLEIRETSWTFHWWNRMFENNHREGGHVPKGSILHMLFYCFERCHRYDWEIGSKTEKITVDRYLAKNYSKGTIIVVSLVMGVLLGGICSFIFLLPLVYCCCWVINRQRPEMAYD